MIFASLGVLYSVSPVYDHWFAYYSPIYNLGAFILGIMLAGAVRSGLRVRVPLWAALTLASVVYVTVSALWPDGPRGLANALMLIPALLLIGSAATQDVEGRRSVWATTPLVLLGQWSFGLYLVHYMVVRLIGRYLPESVSANPVLGVAGMLLFLALATAVAAVAFYLIEKPVQRLLRPRVKRKTAEPTVLASEPF